MTARLH